jgi:hypothetical protein
MPSSTPTIITDSMLNHMTHFRQRIRPHVTAELKAGALAEARGDMSMSFAHLERAHVLGQASTAEHVRVHVRMLAWAVKRRDVGEALGQMLRIVGAATMTAFGLVPHGNTGGANVSPIKPMPIPDDLEAIILQARRSGP